jgi:hypothetical protein
MSNRKGDEGLFIKGKKERMEKSEFINYCYKSRLFFYLRLCVIPELE